MPKERDSILTTPAESTVTGVPSSENLEYKNKQYSGLQFNWEDRYIQVYVSNLPD